MLKNMYFLNFIEEYWNVKPEYQDWCFGRVEIFKDDEQWAINELRFATPPTKEWFAFREKWDFKELKSLKKFEKLLAEFQCK